MSDDPATPAEAAPAPAGGSSKVVPVLLLLNLAATGALGFLQVRHHDAPAAPAAAGKPAAPPPPGPVAALDPFVVNLNEPGPSRYLKATFEVELASGGAAEDLEKARRPVHDQVLRYLSGLSVNDTLGTQNKNRIQSDIVALIDKQLGGEKVRRVFFDEFVVQ